MQLELTRDAEEFAAIAGAYLNERVERNVLATVLAGVRSGHFAAHPPLFACCFDDRDELQAVAMRTPPWTMLASGFDESTAEVLIERWLIEDPSLPAVNGEPPTARAIAQAWSRRTGRPARCSLQEAMHLLSSVDDPPRPAHGALRVASEEDRTLLVGWEQAFVGEAGTGVAEEAPRTVAARLARGAQRVWEDGGAASTLVLSPAIAGTVRIGPVYTPPEHRCRGYATSAVAAAAREALAAGARRCMLFTDLANPTSNRIYASVGFRRFGQWEEHRFD